MATPIDAIIKMFETEAEELTASAVEELHPNSLEFSFRTGKAAGLFKAAEHLRNLQKLFS